MDIITKVLPDDCMSLIISFTSPPDAWRMALVSHAFRSVADSDAVWEMFLPDDYKEIISKSSSASLLLLAKKGLYFSLCYHSILIHNGAMVSPNSTFCIKLLQFCLEHVLITISFASFFFIVFGTFEEV